MRRGVENREIKFNNITMKYVVFGSGPEQLVIVPGLGDSFNSVWVNGNTLLRQFNYLTEDFRIYVFSRRNHLPDGFTNRDMADDLHGALQYLGLDTVSMMGLSQGGMIAQYYAIDYPQSLKKLVIAVSLSRANQVSKPVFGKWHDLAVNGQYPRLIRDTVRKTYPSQYCKILMMLPVFFGMVRKPSSLRRFIIQNQACLKHNAYHELHRIKTPTLILGGMKDEIVGTKAALEMSEAIPNAILKEYKDMGHNPMSNKPLMKDLYQFLVE